MLTYPPAEMIRLHASRGLCAPASTHRLQNHSETPPKQSGTSGARPSPSVSCQEGTWDHKGCWDCCRAPTIYWHFREAGEERRVGVRRNTVRIQIKNLFVVQSEKMMLSVDPCCAGNWFSCSFLPDWMKQIGKIMSVLHCFFLQIKFIDVFKLQSALLNMVWRTSMHG